MRGRLAATSADRISRAVVLMAGVSCGALVLFVGLPLARSSPYPTPRDGGWVIQAAPSYQLASASAMPRAIEPQEPTAIEAQAAIEWEALMAPTVTREMPAMFATIIPEPIWGPDPYETVAAAEANAPMHVASIASASPTAPAAAPAKRNVAIMDDVDEYLWEVYQREPVKKDSTGDFTWKDAAAAKRVGKSMPDYVIGGMDRDFREQLYHAGKAMDATGLQWSMLSAFRDDYRQTIASGFKASSGNSLHGGSRAVGGYGHGRAVDVVSADGDHSAVWRWLDRNGAKYGLRRPMPGADPAHIQAGGAWQSIAVALRGTRVKLAGKETPAARTKVAKNAQ